MGDVVQLGKIQLPAAFAGAANENAHTEFAGGVQAGFPIISFRGKVWRVRKGGEERNFVDAHQNPIPQIEVVLLKGNPRPSKTFYEGAYQEGSNDMPTCWSTDGLTPDADVPDPVHDNCAACPNNVWGSAITPTGKKSRACSDVRRTAVVFANNLTQAGANATPLLLRIPPASLNPLKDYVEKVLRPAGVQPFHVVTAIGFDISTAHPKLTFRPVRAATEAEAHAIIALRDSPDVEQIISAGVGAEIAAETGASAVAAAPAPAPAPAAAPPPAVNRPKAAGRVRPQPVNEEDIDDVPTPTPAPVTPTGASSGIDDLLGAATGQAAAPEAPQAAPKRRGRRKAAAPAQEAAAPSTPPPAGPSPAHASGTEDPTMGALAALLDGGV